MSLAKPTHQLSILNVPQCDIALIISRHDTFEMSVVKRKANVALMGCFNLLLSFEVPKLDSTTTKNNVTRLLAVKETRQYVIWADGNDVVLDSLDIDVGFYVPNNHLLVSAETNQVVLLLIDSQILD